MFLVIDEDLCNELRGPTHRPSNSQHGGHNWNVHLKLRRYLEALFELQLGGNLIVSSTLDNHFQKL